MKNKIKKPLKEGLKESDLEFGTMMFRSWKALVPAIREAFALKKNEEIVGIIADDDGITVKLEYK